MAHVNQMASTSPYFFKFRIQKKLLLLLRYDSSLATGGEREAASSADKEETPILTIFCDYAGSGYAG